ncbi:MAG TPA: thioredoxin family protein [Candidatus Acidoferrales bacterium]|nr:thioredoxin family protein [Candidatus Acidoferrales bacterium]
MVEDVTAAELDDILRTEPRLVMIEFWSDGCAPCRRLRPDLERLAEQEGQPCRILAVNAGTEMAAAERYHVRSQPTLVFVKSGVELHRLHAGAL